MRKLEVIGIDPFGLERDSPAPREAGLVFKVNQVNDDIVSLNFNGKTLTIPPRHILSSLQIRSRLTLLELVSPLRTLEAAHSSA